MPDSNQFTADVRPIRVVVQQPTVPKYRVPVFRELAARSGIELRLVDGASRSGPPPAQADGFVHQCEPMSEWSIADQRLFWHGAQIRWASRSTTDVLILSWNIRYASLIPALLRARANGVSTILWGHGYSKQEAGWRAWPREHVARLATALLFYNHTAAQAYLDRGWDPDRIFVALNALDQAPIQAARRYWLDRPSELAQFRRERGLDRSPVVLFVSRFEPANRVDLLIRATAQLRGQHPDLQTVIIGKGEPEESRLKQLAASLGVGDCVRFAGAIYDECELAPWFMSASVFCYPANVGLSILHAFGYGLPVVTSDDLASQNPEVEALRPGDNGLLYRHEDVKALVDVLGQVLSQPAEVEQMRQAALGTVTQRFTIANMVGGIESAIRFAARKVERTG